MVQSMDLTTSPKTLMLMDCVRETEMVHMIKTISYEVGPMEPDSEHIYSCAWWVAWHLMVPKKMSHSDLLAFSIACDGGIVFW